MEPVLELKNVSFRYSKDSRRVLNDLSYSFEEGKLYAIVGRSGAGKTTLLSLLSGLAVPEKGEVLMRGENIANLDRYHYRSHDIGVIFQSFNLLPKYTALEKVLLSMDIAKAHYDDKKQYAMDLLKKVALDEEETNRRILKLSGGSSSAWQLHGPCPMIRRSFLRMNRREIWIRRRRKKSWIFSWIWLIRRIDV